MKNLGIIYVVLASLSYAGLNVSFKYGLNEGLHPLSLAVSLNIPVITFCLAYIYIKRGEIRVISKKYWILIAIAATVNTFLGRTLHILGTNYTSAINAGFLLRLTALTAPVFAFLILKEKLRNKDYFAIFILISGAYLLTVGGRLTGFNIGDGILIFLTILLGFGNTIGKKVMSRVNPYTFSSLRLVIGGTLLFIFVPFVLGKDSFGALFNLGFEFILICGFFIIGLTFFLNKSIEVLGVSKAIALFLLGSVFTALFAYIFLDEILTFIQGVGAVCILLGAYIITRKSKEVKSKV